MAVISYSQNILSQVDVGTGEVTGATVREALECASVANSRLKGYLLNDDGSLRKHVTIFVDGIPLQDRENLSDAVAGESDIFVMQALSGG